MTPTDATRATAEALPGINRRRFLLNTAVIGASATVAASTVPADPEMTPREQAIWHMRELERLAAEDGAAQVAVIISARKDFSDHSDQQLLMIDCRGNIDDRYATRLFAAEGGEA